MSILTDVFFDPFGSFTRLFLIFLMVAHYGQTYRRHIIEIDTNNIKNFDNISSSKNLFNRLVFVEAAVFIRSILSLAIFIIPTYHIVDVLGIRDFISYEYLFYLALIGKNYIVFGSMVVHLYHNKVG